MDQSLLLAIHNPEDGDPSPPTDFQPLTVAHIKAPLRQMKGREDREDLYNCFQMEYGGMRGYDDASRKPTKTLYIFGVIDILQMFNAKKKIESNSLKCTHAA